MGHEIIYGRKPLQELLKHAPELLESLLVDADASKRQALTEIQSLASKRGIRCERVSHDELDKRCHSTEHQGVLGLLKTYSPKSLEDIIACTKREGSSGLVVVLDQINDPQNLGALLRVAEASGVDGVVVTSRRSASMTPAVRKASAGASELIPYCEVKNLQQALRALKNAGIWIVGTSLGEDSVSLYESEIPMPAAVVLGSEGKGMRELTSKECDLSVMIPLRGRVQSLNVSQAASVVLFEIIRQSNK